jgi:hypothetical protein
MYKPLEIHTLEVCGLRHAFVAMRNPMMSHDKATPESDLELASRLIRAGDEHAKSMRGVIVYATMRCQVGWMIEFDTYRFGIETLSTSSTMHIDYKTMTGEELADAKQNGLPDVIYTRTFMASYQTLRRIYQQRRGHRLPDWKIFCEWIHTPLF